MLLEKAGSKSKATGCGIRRAERLYTPAHIERGLLMLSSD
jgi:hypothetical protein